MSDEIKLQITETGTIRSIYKDGLSQEIRDLLGAKMNVDRASHVEWEEVNGRSGWTVRAAWNTAIAIMYDEHLGFHVDTEGLIYLFPTRAEALACELAHFWELLPKEKP